MNVVLVTIRDGVLVKTSFRTAVPLPPAGPYWVVHKGRLLATNHKLWAGRVGQPLPPGQIENTLKLAGRA